MPNLPPGEILKVIPHGYAEVVKLYGDASQPSFVRNLIMMEFPYPLEYLDAPITHCTVHRLAGPNLWAALSLIQERGLQGEFKRYAGVYCYRPKRGVQQMSMHAFGIAIDGDAEKYPLGSADRYPDEVIECFRQFGWFYGGDFSGRKDPMHFQLAAGV